MIGYSPNALCENLVFSKQDILDPKSKSQHKLEKTRNVGGQNFTSRDGFQENEEFSQSVDVTRSFGKPQTQQSVNDSFVQSVVVISPSTPGGRYSIYPGIHETKSGNQDYDFTSSFVESCQYQHNISNPDLRQKTGSTNLTLQQRLMGKLFRKGQSEEEKFVKSNFVVKSKGCQCNKYHSHKFEIPPFVKKMPSSLPAYDKVDLKAPDVSAAIENHRVISNMFWKPGLSFCEFSLGNELVKFSSLWPSDREVEALLHHGVEETGLRGALWEMCMLSLAGGAISVLKNLLEQKFISVDHKLDNDPTLLHLSCVMRNIDVVNLLVQYGASTKLKDRQGKTAEEVCFCGKTRRLLPTRYQPSKAWERMKPHTKLTPIPQDKEAIFRLASRPRALYDLLVRLQMYDFDVNTEQNNAGDYIIHVAAKAGIGQLPLLLMLAGLLEADMNVCNSAGMTPLMILAAEGDSVICDVAVCVLGADPNRKNSQDGKTALHYAVMGNHVNTVECLIKRGADFNIEDDDMCRPDDLHLLTYVIEECEELIKSRRQQRFDSLVEAVEQDAVDASQLRRTDMSVVDSEGYTLIMLAAEHNKVTSLEVCLQVSSHALDAQHTKTGCTALAMAAKKGNHKCCHLLLRYGASVRVADMMGYLPLHHAVLGNHEETVEEFTDQTNFVDSKSSERLHDVYVGLHEALRLCRKSSIHDRLTITWEKRQEDLVKPQLHMCAMQGNADRLFSILEPGDFINCKSNLNNEPALFDAVRNNYMEVVQLLIEWGTDIRQRDSHTGETVLHIVASKGHLEIARYLLELPTPRGGLDINALNCDKKTPLLIAAENGFLKLVSLLINNGATTAVLDQEGALFSCPVYEGARIQIEACRQEHTRHVMHLIAEKNKKYLVQLSHLWVPRFDHNLRDVNKDTPLMLSCRLGRLEVTRFLLESAVYSDHVIEEEGDASDTDSGVPDLPVSSAGQRTGIPTPEDVYGVLERTFDQQDNLPLGASCEMSQPNGPYSIYTPPTYTPPLTEGGRGSDQFSSYLSQVKRPKGLYIYHDGLVSHVCAVNLYMGNTPLHCAVEGGDNVDIVAALIAADSDVVNMQNDSGLTALHLACKLGRKKILQYLLDFKGIDLNLYTRDGHLPEELTTKKRLKQMVQKAREGLQGSSVQSPDAMSLISESVPSVHSTGGGSTINFDKIDERYQSLRQSKSPQSHLGK